MGQGLRGQEGWTFDFRASGDISIEVVLVKSVRDEEEQERQREMNDIRSNDLEGPRKVSQDAKPN